MKKVKSSHEAEQMWRELEARDTSYGERYRDIIVKSVIKRAGPHWYSWFNICPLNDAQDVLGARWDNPTHQFLRMWHCVGYWKIPREIRVRIPDLIREALTPPK